MVEERDPNSVLDSAREHRHGVRSAIADLERGLAAPSPAGVEVWGKEIEVRVAALRDAFDRHVASAERAGGIFEEIVTHAPRLSNKVDGLRRDHQAVCAEIDAFASQFGTAITDADVVAVREAGVALLAHLARHRHRGSDLVYEAYTVDIEAAD